MGAVKVGALALICAVMLIPVGMMVVGSFTPAASFLAANFPPREYTTRNYERILRLPTLGRWLANSAILIGAATIGGTLINGAAGYAFASRQGKWKDILFWLMMVPIFVTRFVLLISQFQVVGWLHLSGPVAVVVMTLYWPTGIYLFRNYFQSLPAGIVECARIDGAGEWRILTQIVLPMAKPIVGVAIVSLGMMCMGDYIWQMLNLRDPRMQTLLVGLMASTLSVYVIKDVGYDLAVGTVLFVPYLVIFAASSRYFVEGLKGAVKE